MKHCLPLLSAMVAVLSMTASGATYTWKSGVDGNWNDAANWFCYDEGKEGIPGEGDVAKFAEGATGRVVLGEATTISQLDVSSSGTSVTLVMPTGSTFSATNVLVVGESSTLVIDAQGGATFSKPAKTRLSTGAKLNLLNGVKYSTDGTYTLGEGASLKMTGGTCFSSGDHIILTHSNFTLELDDSNMFSWNTIQLGDGFRLIARGERAQLSPRSGFSAKGSLTVDVELPESDFSTRYNFAGNWRTSQGLIANGADGMSFPGGGTATFNILKSSPARQVKGTRLYTLVNCSGSGGKKLDTSKVTITGFKYDDHAVYTWEDGADPETDAAYRLQASITGGLSGFRIAIR